MSNSKKQQLSEIQTLVTGMPKYCASMSFTLNGVTYTSAQLVQMGTEILAADEATVQAKAAYKGAVAAEQSLLTTNHSVIEGLKQNLGLVFGNSPATLAGLGIVPRKKPAPLSSAALAAKTAKAEATRKARGTTSKKVKAAISGNVSGVTITPQLVAPMPSAPAAATASSIAAASTGTSAPHS